MPKLETFLEDGLRSELMLQHHLKALSEALMQQLQETERRQKEELERRIHQNSLLSTRVDGESGDGNDQGKHVAMMRSTSTSGQISDKETLHHTKQSSPAWASSNWKNSSVGVSVLASAGTQQCERFALSKTTQACKEEEAEAECQRKFCALPVPSHVMQPLYKKMMELREKKRKQGHEQRRAFLLSTQRPFSFQEREKEKMEKMMAELKQVSDDQKNKDSTFKQPPHKVVKDSDLKDQELCRHVPTQTTEQPENSSVSGHPNLHISERTRKEKLGFLDERPSFHPKIITRVPDFSRLHKALQTEALRTTQSKDGIKCQPFYLRTSVLPARQSKMSPEYSQVQKINNLSRSKSLGALTSLSADTLPTYITDAVRKRCTAIRKSMEMRDSKNQESADWLRKHQMRSQAMKKTVALHAKLLDPHSSLKEVYNDKLQHHREADQQRMREYMRELRDIKARVCERPYLFEQVKQKNAKAHVEQTYRNKLKKAGVKEQFVERNGASASEEDIDANASTENHIRSREENVDDGEKIEDVEEKSVKSKGKKMP